MASLGRSTPEGFAFEALSIDLSLDDFMMLLPARQRRSYKRGFSDEKKKLIAKLHKKDNVKTHLRDMIVLPIMIGKTIQVHTGKAFIPIVILTNELGNVEL